MLAREMENNWVCTSAVSLDAIMKRDMCKHAWKKEIPFSVSLYAVPK